MTPGTAILNEDDLARYRFDHALRFLLLTTLLDEADGEMGRVARGSSALQATAKLTGAQIADNASSFFWFYSDLLYAALSQGAPVSPERLQLFLVHLMDSLFPVLRDSDAVVLTGAVTDVVLPRLGVVVPGGGGAVELVRRSRHEIAVVGEGLDDVLIDLEAPGDHRLSKRALHGGAHLLAGIDSLIDDELMQKKMADFSAEELGDFGSLLDTALDLIAAADEPLSQRIDELVKWYFPIQTPDKRRVHNSFTVSSLNGAIFLSESYSFLPLAEALVHEFHHNELWMAMSIEKHLCDDGEEVLYSPWRPDARPLQGIYHAIYVFTCLLEFFAAGERKPGLSEHHRHFNNRRRGIYHQLRTALDQIRRDDLMPRGAELVDMLGEIVQAHGAELGLTNDAVPEPQRRHWLEWTARHPHLRAGAVRPIGAEGDV